MTALTWDGTGEKQFEVGVDHGVLYIPTAGAYDYGVAWNGLVTVTESPTGAEPTDTYADNILYATLRSAEKFGGTIEAYTYPDEFAEFDGLGVPSPGVNVGQQSRGVFGMSYRTKIGNDVDGQDAGYKLHLVYGATASPSEKAYGTISDSPEMITFSYEFTTVPVNATGMNPTSIITISSLEADATALAALEELLYGGVSSDPSLPTPDEVVALFAGTATATNVTVVAATDAVAIGGTTTNVLFSLRVWDGDSWEPVVGGTLVNEAAAEALTLVTGSVYEVTLHAATGYYVPAAQQETFFIVPT